MVNNFKEVRKYLINEGIPIEKEKAGDEFFCIFLVRRGKDHPKLLSANYTFKTYYLDSIEELNKFEKEIISCCDMFGLRAYISINIKSKELFTKSCSVKFATNIENNEYKKPWRIINHVFGKLRNKNENRWIIDLDSCEGDSKKVKEILQLIKKCDSKYDDPFITSFNTKSGVHLITHPFNLDQFSDLCKLSNVDKPEILKNRITLLYENIKDIDSNILDNQFSLNK